MTYKAHIVIGVGYVLASLVLFALNALLWLVCKRKEYRTRTYKIIRHLCFACMMQLTIFMVSGAMTIAQNNFGYVNDKVCGALIQSGWFLYIGLSLTLAVDRLFTFLGYTHSPIWNAISFALLVASWLMWSVFLVFLLLPDFAMTYVGFYRWDYNDDRQIMIKVEKIVDFSAYIVVFTIYIIVFVFFLKMRCLSPSSNTQWIHMEFRLLTVAAISFSYEMIFDVFWFWGRDFIPNGILADCLANVLWILDCGLFAALTFVISRSIRRKVFFMVCKRHIKITVASTNLQQK
uniref:G_PROTEIN_RECEP_F1_2 domain-containing protein n=1 Tax=Steinernema glaseri TaxID=37863 RepID=A0A1I8AUS6_9BILA